MAISPALVYPAQTEAPSPQYPFGASQNVTTSGDNTGTPWEKEIIDDMLGFFQALLDSNADSPTGVPDRVGASQYLDAIMALIGGGTVNNWVHGNSGADFSIAPAAGSDGLAAGWFAASGDRSLSLGFNAQATFDDSVAIGSTARTFQSNEMRVAIGGNVINGFDEASVFTSRAFMRYHTANNTPTELGVGATSSLPTGQVLLETDSNISFVAHIVARGDENLSTGNAWRVEGMINDTNIVGTPTVYTIGEMEPTWSFVITTPGTPGNPFVITVVGDSTDRVAWYADVTFYGATFWAGS